MKITKKQLRQIVRSTTELLNESRFGSVGLGFQNWSANKNPDFAKAYGKDARVLRDFGSNEDRQSRVKESMHQTNALEALADESVLEIENMLDRWEQPVPGAPSDPRADDVYDLLFQVRERMMAILENRE
jgi:hypothetical protein